MPGPQGTCPPALLDQYPDLAELDPETVPTGDFAVGVWLGEMENRYGTRRTVTATLRSFPTPEP